MATWRSSRVSPVRRGRPGTERRRPRAEVRGARRAGECHERSELRHGTCAVWSPGRRRRCRHVGECPTSVAVDRSGGRSCAPFVEPRFVAPVCCQRRASPTGLAVLATVGPWASGASAPTLARGGGGDPIAATRCFETKTLPRILSSSATAPQNLPGAHTSFLLNFPAGPVASVAVWRAQPCPPPPPVQVLLARIRRVADEAVSITASPSAASSPAPRSSS